MTYKESFLHKAAKELVADWLRVADKYDDCGDFWDISALRFQWRAPKTDLIDNVYLEYPVVCDPPLDWRSEQNVFGHQAWWQCLGFTDDPNRPPTYEECVRLGARPDCVIDIAVLDQSAIKYAIEIVHTSPVSYRKARLLSDLGIQVVCVSAEWVMRQSRRPEFLVADRDFFEVMLGYKEWREAQKNLGDPEWFEQEARRHDVRILHVS